MPELHQLYTYTADDDAICQKDKFLKMTAPTVPLAPAWKSFINEIIKEAGIQAPYSLQPSALIVYVFKNVHCLYIKHNLFIINYLIKLPQLSLIYFINSLDGK